MSDNFNPIDDLVQFINHQTDADKEKRKSDFAEARQLTFGEKLVGVNFNPSADDKVDRVKRLFAEAADILNDENSARETSQFSQRLFSHAVCEILNAQMNVVKVLTLKY